MAKNLITRHELKNIVSLSVNKKTLEDAKSQLAGLLNNLDVDFSSEDFKQGFKDIVAMFNAAFEQAGKDIDLSSMMPSRENFVKLGQEYRAAFEEALSELSLKGGFRFDFASEDLKQAVVYLEKIATNTAKKTNVIAKKASDDINAALYRLKDSEEKVAEIQDAINLDPKKVKKPKDPIKKLKSYSTTYDTSDNWEEKYKALLQYVALYERLDDIGEVDFNAKENAEFKKLYNIFSKGKENAVTSLTNLLYARSTPTASGSTAGQVANIEIKTDGLATEATLGKIRDALKGESNQGNASKNNGKTQNQTKQPSHYKTDGILTKKDENSFELFKKRLINQFNELNRGVVESIVEQIELDGLDKAGQQLYSKLYRYKIADLAANKEDFDINEQNISHLLHVYYELQHAIDNELIPSKLADSVGNYSQNLVNFLYDDRLFDQDKAETIGSILDSLDSNSIGADAFVNNVKKLILEAVLDTSKIGTSAINSSELYKTADDGIKDNISVMSEIVGAKSTITNSTTKNEDLQDDLSLSVKRLSDFNDALLQVTNRLNRNTSGLADLSSVSSNVNQMVELINSLNSKTKISGNEHGTFFNSATGDSDEIISGVGDAIILKPIDYQKAAKKYDARIHTHTAAVGAPSVLEETNDFQTWIDSFGLFKKQIIATKQELLSFDFSSLSLDQLKKIRDDYRDEVSKIDKDSIGTEELQVRMRQALEKIIAPYGSNIMKSYKVPNVISNSFTENDNTVSVLNEISRKIDSLICNTEVLKLIVPENSLDNNDISEDKLICAFDDLTRAIDKFIGDQTMSPKEVLDGLLNGTITPEKLGAQEALRILGMLDVDGSTKFRLASDGVNNVGTAIGNNLVYLTSKLSSIGDVQKLMEQQEQAYKLGASVPRILASKTDDKRIYQLQTIAPGVNLRASGREEGVLQADNEQIDRLLHTFDVLEKLGLRAEFGGDNIMYDHNKGFTMIDLDNTSKHAYSAGTSQKMLELLIKQLEKSYGTDANKLIDKLKERYALKPQDRLVNADTIEAEKRNLGNNVKDDTDNKTGSRTVAIDEEGLKKVFNDTTFKVQMAKSEKTEDEDKEDPKLKQIEEKISDVQTTVNKIDTNVNKEPKEHSTLSKILEHVNSIDGKLVDGAKEKSKKQEEKERKQQGLDELAQKAKLLGQLEAKDKIFGSVEALEQAIALEEELKTGFKDLGFDENSAEWDKLTKARSDAYNKEVDSAKIKDSDKIRLRVLHDLKDSYKEFGEILAKVEIAKEENDEQEIARLEKERANIKKKIDEQKKHIKLTSSEDKDLTTIQTEQKNKVREQYDEKKQQAYNDKIKELINLHEKLGKLEAKSEATNDPKATVDLKYLRDEIDLELQKLGIIKDINNEQYKAFDDAREKAKIKQAEIETGKQQKKDLKSQIKEEKKRVRISDADAADRSANKTLLSLWKIDDESIDTTNLAEVTKLTGSLKELKNTRDMVNKTIASGKDVKDEYIAKLRENTQEVIKHQTAVKELIENYERFSDGNSKSLNAILNPNSDVKSQLEAQVKAFHGAGVKIKEYDAKTKTLTYTVKTGANEFTTYTAGVRQVDNALRTVQGTTTRTETLFESIARKTKEIFTYFSGSSVIYKAFNEFQKGIQYVREIDSALTELKKVTDETEESYDRFLKTASKTADKVGSTIAKVVNSTADWARLNI